MVYVSGPTCVFRLENKNKHPIYLFGDYHNTITDQNECPISVNSIRIDQLLKLWFKSKKKIGFFLETTKDNVYYYNNIYNKYKTQPYLHSLRTLLSDNLQFNSNKIINSKNFPNVMFHYFDIRLDLPEYEYFLSDQYITIHNTTDNLKLLEYNFHNFITIFNKSKDFQKLLKKKYNNNSLKKNIFTLKKQIFTECDNFHLNKSINKSEKYYKKYNDSKFVYNNNKLEKIINKSKNLYYTKFGDAIVYILMLNDLYLLRRLLDKKYNSDIDIVYSGSWHTLNIVFFLLKYTDYKITHCSGNTQFILDNYQNYSPKWFANNIEIISNNTLEYTDFDFINQCVDLSKFPQEF